MSYTPVELRHVRVGRRPLGYHRAGIEKILSDVADSFEVVWRDRGELADRVEQLQDELEAAKSREQLLTNTLVAAEHAAGEMRDRARREAELIVAEAHAEARTVMHTGQGERERLLGEVRRIESLLRSALGIVTEAHEPEAAASEVATAPPAQTEQQPKADEAPEQPQLSAAPPAERDPAAAHASVAEEAPIAPEDEVPGWPPLRKVAQAGSDFDWGD
jgi:cell division initiation protein